MTPKSMLGKKSNMSLRKGYTNLSLGSPFGIARQSLVMPNSEPWDRFVYAFHKLLIDSYNMSPVIRKPDFCICENKGADQLRGNTKAQISFAVTAKLISAFVFATRVVQSLYFLNPKFQDLTIFCGCTDRFV